MTKFDQFPVAYQLTNKTNPCRFDFESLILPPRCIVRRGDFILESDAKAIIQDRAFQISFDEGRGGGLEGELLWMRDTRKGKARLL